jgi:tetratricopeptide (TPR) repeat protein
MFFVAACGGAQTTTSSTSPSASPSASVAPNASASASSAVEAPPPVPHEWIEDDYARALATAKRSHAPLFVDASAVWCHTCKAMRAFVLDDPSLPAGVVRFSFDVEKEKNADATAAFPAHVLPTFFVVDSSDGSIHGRWEGAGSVQQMRAFVTDAMRSIAQAHAGSLDPNDPFAMLLAGDRAALKGDAAEAEKQFARAIAAAPPTWGHFPEAALGLISSERHEASCLETAEKYLGDARLGESSVMVDFASSALECTETAHADAARAKKIAALVASRVAHVASDDATLLSPDDRADAWHVVWDARETLGDHKGAQDAARARLAVIMKAVAARPEPEIATTFDGARMETLEFLGRGAEAAQFLAAQEKALPNDYNPPHRLAHVYFKLGKNADALAAIDRALAKGYGARKGLMYRLKADILMAMNKKTEARAALEAQLALYRSLPDSQKKPGYERTVQEQIDKLK